MATSKAFHRRTPLKSISMQWASTCPEATSHLEHSRREGALLGRRAARGNLTLELSGGEGTPGSQQVTFSAFHSVLENDVLAVAQSSQWQSIMNGLSPERCVLPHVSHPDSYSCHIGRGPYPTLCGAGTLLASSVSLRLSFLSRMNS